MPSGVVRGDPSRGEPLETGCRVLGHASLRTFGPERAPFEGTCSS
jgi:hypothetical protein